MPLQPSSWSPDRGVIFFGSSATSVSYTRRDGYKRQVGITGGTICLLYTTRWV
ncbi:hypothetical protein [Erwinia amylovora]